MLDNRPLVTVIVPVYNGADYIEDCIRSILRQDYHNLEVLVVDDGSTDSSVKILETLSEEDSRIKLTKKKNSGVSPTRNYALDMAKGEFVCLVDQDDEIDPDYVSYFLSLIEKNGADIALTPQPYKFNEKNKTQKKGVEDDAAYCCSGSEAAEKMLYYRFVIAPWNKMIRRGLIEENEIRFREDLFGGEGFCFSVECFLSAKKVAVGSRKVYNYRVDNPNSGMTKFTTRIVESSMLAQKYLKKSVEEKAPGIIRACRYANWHTCVDCYNMMVGCKVEQKYPKMYADLKRTCRKEAMSVFSAPISLKEKLKGALYLISPSFAARLINRFRIRKFTVD